MNHQPPRWCPEIENNPKIKSSKFLNSKLISPYHYDRCSKRSLLVQFLAEISNDLRRRIIENRQRGLENVNINDKNVHLATGEIKIINTRRLTTHMINLDGRILFWNRWNALNKRRRKRRRSVCVKKKAILN